jgi:hypothetical protein
MLTSSYASSIGAVSENFAKAIYLAAHGKLNLIPFDPDPCLHATMHVLAPPYFGERQKKERS